MNSSISSSEHTAKTGFILTFCSVILLLIMTVWTILIVVDPYDTGRLTFFQRTGTFEKGPRTGNVSRIRNPEFNAAIFGNSTIQLINPERLNALTGKKFQQLSTPATGPMEQLVLIDYMIRKRGNEIKTVIIGLDLTWCDPSRETKAVRPFPFWLYDPNDQYYLIGLFRFEAVQSLYRRTKILLGRDKVANQDGFWDYDATRSLEKINEANFIVPELQASKTNRHSASVALKKALALLPEETSAVLIHLPIFVASGEHISDASSVIKNKCKEEIKLVASNRERTFVIDRWIDDKNTRDKSLFFDYIHYRTDFAKDIEIDISRTLSAAK